MKIQYDLAAKRQIREIFDYGKEYFGLHTACKFKNAIRNKVNELKQQPNMGSTEWLLTTPEHKYRYILLSPYKIIYSVKKDVIRIHLFWHTRRNPDSLMDYPIGVSEASISYGME